MRSEGHGRPSQRRRSRRTALLTLTAGGAVLAAVGCAKRQVPPIEVVAVHAAALPAGPADPAWQRVPVFTAPLVLQDMVEPRLMIPSTLAVQVQALTDGTRIAFRLTWPDSTRDDLPGAGRFTDACAVQLPAAATPDVPAPQMGEAGMPVDITYWSAAWQAQVDGRPDSIQAYYPNASIDHYPFEAPVLPPGSAARDAMTKRYSPSRAVNRLEHPANRPVQDLRAEGPGTITPLPETRSNGAGAWAGATWSVVIAREMPAALHGQARSQVAFAIWQGARQEVGSRKMRSVWVPLSLGGGA